MNKEYEKAFKNWSKLHQHRYSTGEMGKKYIRASKKLAQLAKTLPERV